MQSLNRISGFGSRPLMPLPLRRRVSRLFTLLPTTSTSFVTTYPTRSSTINRLSRIVVAGGGSVTTQVETVGVIHSRRGKKYCCSLSFPVIVHWSTYKNPRHTRSIPTPISPSPSNISCLAVNNSSGPNSPPPVTLIQSFGPVPLLPLKCFGADLEGMARLLWRGCTTSRTG